MPSRKPLLTTKDQQTDLTVNAWPLDIPNYVIYICMTFQEYSFALPVLCKGDSIKVLYVIVPVQSENNTPGHLKLGKWT